MKDAWTRVTFGGLEIPAEAVCMGKKPPEIAPSFAGAEPTFSCDLPAGAADELHAFLDALTPPRPRWLPGEVVVDGRPADIEVLPFPEETPAGVTFPGRAWPPYEGPLLADGTFCSPGREARERAALYFDGRPVPGVRNVTWGRKR